MKNGPFSGFCSNCRKPLDSIENILFVEKEVGRCFCSEPCIIEYFQPTVGLYEEELEKLKQTWDYSTEEASKLVHYRNLVLGDPDEIWVDESENGDHIFTFIANFLNRNEKFSYVVITLAIEGHPSFVFLSFPTKDEDLLEVYRRGQEIRLDVDPEVAESELAQESEDEEGESAEHTLDEEVLGSEEEQGAVAVSFENLYRELRQPTDIPIAEFPKYTNYIEATIDDSEEIWHLIDDEGNEWCTFISKYKSEQDLEDFTMVVVCEPALEEPEVTGEQFSSLKPVKRKSFEVVFAFPTIDPGLTQHFRKGVNSLNKTFGVGWSSGRAA